jgi:cell division ATPase FtsA
VLIADIGADDLTVLLSRNGELWFARTILGGGRRFTQVIADELKIEVAEAEQFKRTQAEIIFDLQAPVASGTRVRIPGATRPNIRGMTGIIPKTERSGVIKLDPASSASVAAPGSSSATGSTASETVIGIPKPGASASAPAPAAQAAPITPDALPGSEDLFMLDMPPSVESLGGSDPAPAAPPAPEQPTEQAATGEPSPAAPDVANKDMADLPLASPGATGAADADDKTPGPGGVPKWVSALGAVRQKQISTALVREAASICAALENAVLVTKQQTKLRDLKIDRVYLTGGGSKLKGLQEFMQRRMRLEVMPLEPLKQISLQRLPAEQAASLKNEQHTMAVSLGLALTPRKGTFGFQLWPAAMEKKKIFWSRGAYLYYAAAMVAVAVGLFLFTPYRNSQALMANTQLAAAAVETAQHLNDENTKLGKKAEEWRRRSDQIEENNGSGEKFLTILAELKSRSTKDMKGRIGDDIYITSVSTHIPAFLIRLYSETSGAPKGPAALAANKTSAASDTNDTFQEQRRIYIRGFAVSSKDTDLVNNVRDFYNNLVPHENQPDHADNLFTDVYDIWYGKKQQSGNNYVLEFVLELYTAGAREEATAGGSPGPRPGPRPVRSPRGTPPAKMK